MSNNIFLQGAFAPWRSENHFANLEVDGKIPKDLQGILLRNGPNPQFDPTGPYHWFLGDGMLHAITINSGNASYMNRWVRTERFNAEHEAGKALFDTSFTGGDPDPVLATIDRNPANTAIVSYNRQLLALCEGGSPISIQRSNLRTNGVYTFQGQITTALSAHPRYDYARQELLTYSYINPENKLIYYRLNRHNQLINRVDIAWPYPVMLHDFIITKNYVIFPLFPCTFLADRREQGNNPFMWEGDKLPSCFIITDKAGNEVLRLETDPCYAYHFGNAYEMGDSILIDAMVSKKTELMLDRYGNMAKPEEGAATLARWQINLKNKTMRLTYLDDMQSEFPRFDERVNGMSYRYLYAAGIQNLPIFDSIVAYDLQKETKKVYYLAEDPPSEPIFVARSTKEGDGYLLSVVYRTAQDRSDVLILDANHIDDGPIAVIKIPHRIPYGFHGNFIAL